MHRAWKSARRESPRCAVTLHEFFDRPSLRAATVRCCNRFTRGKPVLVDNFLIRGMMSTNIVILVQILAHGHARFE
jgi:hypothetical protein